MQSHPLDLYQKKTGQAESDRETTPDSKFYIKELLNTLNVVYFWEEKFL